MGRIKGWIHTIHTGTRVLCDVDGKDAVFVEQIPKTAIRGETEVVSCEVMADMVRNSDQGVVIDLPDYLIGKKVSYIIIPEEDQ